MIRLQHISQVFRNPSGGNVQALHEVSLEIDKGEIFGIIGRSGAGKSTLVRTLNLLNRPTTGQVFIDGQELTALDDDALRAARRRIGMIFQHFNLLSSRTVFDNVALPLELAGQSPADIRREVEPLLELVGLQTLAKRYPHQLSGGQKQRVGIARALASRPQVLLSDEATSALDPETTRSILELLRRINRELGLTVVLITHEMQVIKQICARVAVMDAGRIIESGPVLDIFRTPRHDITRALIGDVIAHQLPPSVIERVRSRLAGRSANGHDHLLRLAFVGDEVDQPVLSQAVRKFGVDFSILHGQVDEIQGQAFGSLTILAEAAEDTLAHALDFLRSHSITVERLDHVI
jgi:D-methionine transport system ATP-binding protein